MRGSRGGGGQGYPISISFRWRADDGLLQWYLDPLYPHIQKKNIYIYIKWKTLSEVHPLASLSGSAHGIHNKFQKQDISRFSMIRVKLLKRQSRLEQITCDTSFLIVEKNKAWYFMRMVCLQTILMEISCLICYFGKKQRILKLLSAENYRRRFKG